MSVNSDAGKEINDDLGTKSDQKIYDNASKNMTSSPENKPTKDSKGNKRYQTLLKRKESGIIRFSRAKEHLDDLISTYDIDPNNRSSKTSILRAINKVKSEYTVIGELITCIKTEIVVTDEEEVTNVDDIIDILDEELNSMGNEVDASIRHANEQLDERLLNGEKESDLVSNWSSVTSNKTKSSKALELSTSAKLKQQQAKEAQERLRRLEQEQNALKQDLKQKTDMFEQNEKIIEDARSIAKLNEVRAKAASIEEMQKDEITKSKKLLSHTDNIGEQVSATVREPPVLIMPTSNRVKLKGVELPIFSGEDKTKFEPWNAAFISVVDEADIPVREKMLRLQGCLRGKALETVRDLGFSEIAYERAKENLKKNMVGNEDKL